MRRGLVLLLALAGCSSAPLQSDWERAHPEEGWREEQPAPPPYPRAGELLEFSVPEARSFRFFVDASTLSVDRDGVVRYVLVARAADGAQNVSYEGLRCATGEYRIYAIGRPDERSWSPAPGQWQPVASAPRAVLQHEYFCRQTLRDRDEAVRRLRDGRWRSGRDY